MSAEFHIADDVKSLVNEIIERNNWHPISEIKYEVGSDVGDGYLSKTIAVNIFTTDKVHRLFLKYPLNIKSTDAMPVQKAYDNEMYFYNTIYPAYRKFLDERSSDGAFTNVPKCYGTSTTSILAMENLKAKGFTLFDKSNTMNDNHITTVLKTFARFHAVSFAFKDQRRELYNELAANVYDFSDRSNGEIAMEELLKILVQNLRKNFDPIEDKQIYEMLDTEEIVSSITSPSRCVNEYSIITQGDCWCNNIMFLYEEEDRSNPLDIILVDWQLIRQASPVFDFCYFFFPIASEEALKKVDHYLIVYYEELAMQIEQLGSNPDDLYPLSVFKDEWKRHCKYGLAAAVMFLKVMLSTKDEVINMEAVDFNNVGDLFPKYEKEDEYIRRMKVLLEFFIERGY